MSVEASSSDVCVASYPALKHRPAVFLHWAELTFLVLLYGKMIHTFAPSLITNPVNLMLVVSEGLVILFVAVRRPAASLSSRWGDWLLAFAGTAAPLLVHPAVTLAGPELLHRVAWCLLLFGTAFAVWGKITLRRSFGLIAANRGVIIAGPYRFVRHPIYAGYAVTYAGSLMVNPLALNAGLYAVCVTIMVLRILAEERILSKDAAYAELSQRVRHRLIPGVF